MEKVTDGLVKQYYNLLRSRENNKYRMSPTEIDDLRRIVKKRAEGGCYQMKHLVETGDLEKGFEKYGSVYEATALAKEIGRRCKFAYEDEVGLDPFFQEDFFGGLKASCEQIDSVTWRFVVRWPGTDKEGRIWIDRKSWPVGKVEEVRVERWLVKGVFRETDPALIEAGEPRVEHGGSIDGTETSPSSVQTETNTAPSGRKSIYSDLEGLDLSQQPPGTSLQTADPSAATSGLGGIMNDLASINLLQPEGSVQTEVTLNQDSSDDEFGQFFSSVPGEIPVDALTSEEQEVKPRSFI